MCINISDAKAQSARTHVVVLILATNVQHCTRKVAISHLETIIKCPQGCAKTVTETWKATTRSCIRLQHNEGLSIGLRKVGGVEIGSDYTDTGGMTEEAGEHILRVDRSAGAISSITVVRWVT